MSALLVVHSGKYVDRHCLMVRALPVRVPPHPGEGLDSYLEALAARHHAAWGDVLDAVGLEARIVRWAGGVLVADGVAGGPGSRPADQLRGRLRHIAVNDGGGPDRLRRRNTLHRSADGAGVSLAAAVAVLPGMPGRERGTLATLVATAVGLRLPNTISACWPTPARAAIVGSGSVPTPTASCRHRIGVPARLTTPSDAICDGAAPTCRPRRRDAASATAQY